MEETYSINIEGVTLFMEPDKVNDAAYKFRMLRAYSGMNRKEFCEYFDIPYRTVTEWERGNRNAPDYVLRLLAYYIRMEKMVKKESKPIEFEGVNIQTREEENVKE